MKNTSTSAASPAAVCFPPRLASQALERCPAALLLCDVREPGHPVVYANPAFCALTRLDAEEILGRDCSLLHAALYADPGALPDMVRAFAAGEAMRFVGLSRRRDGSTFWNRMSLEPLRDEHGHVTHYVGTHEDVGAQEALTPDDAPAAAREHPRHLLLLDDEPNILRALRRVFRAQPWQVHFASTPDEAFGLLAQHPIGVVVSDQRMPLMRGTEFLARVKQTYPDTVRIVLSGYTELQSVTEAINEGAIYKFLTKPWNDRELNEEIEQAFHQYEIAADNRLLQQRLCESNRLLERRLRQDEQKLRRDEAVPDTTHTALCMASMPVLGIDAAGMIESSNAAADFLFAEGRSLVGGFAHDVLPPELVYLLAQRGGCVPPAVRIDGALYEVRWGEPGAQACGAGSVVALLRGGCA